jgi:hypothetical protein
MTWFLLPDPKYRHAIQEIKKQRDRGAGIMAASILEEHLTAAIKSHIQKNKEIENRMFSGYGPLASFAAKIDFGFLLGLYGEHIHERLQIIRKIRNDFAHNPSPASFKSQRVQCAQLIFPKGLRRKITPLLQEVFKDNPRFHELESLKFAQRSNHPRTQFMRAVQMLTTLLFCALSNDEEEERSIMIIP